MLGLCICTREALKLMKENNNGGHIININSITGHYIPLLPEPVLNIYPATKFAVTALSETLRRELTFAQRKIKVTSLSPGLVKTAWFNGLTPNIKITLSKPEMPVLKPEDVADTIAFILSTPPFVEITVVVYAFVDSTLAKLPKKCEGGSGLKYLWGDALSDSPECVGPTNTPYPTAAIERSFKGSNPWLGSFRTGRSQKTIDPFLTRRALITSYERNMLDRPAMTTSRQGRAVNNMTPNTCAGTPSRLCKTRYNTTAPMYGVSLTSGQPVTIVQKFPDLLQQVVFEVCESSECDVVRGECTQTYVPYLFLVIPLGPVTLTGQDYVLVESGCVCRPKYSQIAQDPSMSSIPKF
ncbi:uncharacterized protein LOC132696686 isoform X2 [Cylas formicarius]|nr:uncharacterized protein LOC132696686 isoform X2 [Cylas formicarius]